MLASVFSRLSASQLLEPGHDPPLGRNRDGLPLIEKLLALVSARLAEPMYAFWSPIAFRAGAPRVCPLESKNCASAHWAAAVVSSLISDVGGSRQLVARTERPHQPDC